LYMAETNLGLNGRQPHHDRLEQGLEHFRVAILERRLTRESASYCMGNAHLALKNYETAVKYYESVLLILEEKNLNNPSDVLIAAQCQKNMGSALEQIGRHHEAYQAFKSALDLEPDLGEAHFAIAFWHKNHDGNLKAALRHFDAISISRGSALSRAAVDGWCAEIHFLLNDSVAAFRAINSLIGRSALDGWEWGWCARLVSEYGRKSASAARSAFTFWRRYFEHHPDSQFAEAERFFCAWHVHSNEERSPMPFDEFQKLGQRLADSHTLEEAFVFDKIAHWAQDEGDSSTAEVWFRKAYKEAPDQYACCFGTILNRLARHQEALIVLLYHARRHKMDPVNWFQIAYAREKLGRIRSAINGYKKAIKYDANYDSAWFNLGGVLWNNGALPEAIAIWCQAINRFPEHEMTKHLTENLPMLKERK
jgi:tetratricopeptide (TPR) repeat protein